MKHNWEDVEQGLAGMWNHGKRRCRNCGAEQIKQAEISWMKVTGYRWLPLVGRCKPLAQGSTDETQTATD